MHSKEGQYLAIDLSITEEMKKAQDKAIQRQVVIAELEKLEAKRFDENQGKIILENNG